VKEALIEIGCVVTSLVVGCHALADDNGGSSCDCELLCFLQQKSKCMTFDDLVVICASIYTVDEIKKALVIMAKCSRQRMPSHKGPEKS